MMFDNIFPYENRKLGLSEMETPREDRLSVKHIAIITIANLNVDDRLTFPKGDVVITAIDDEKISYDFIKQDGTVVQQDVLVEQIENSALCAGLVAVIPTLHPDYSDPMVLLIERDPAVFRLQSQQGWTANDALAKCSGNVQYPLRAASTDTPSSTPDNENSEVPAPKQTQSPTQEGGQAAFEF